MTNGARVAVKQIFEGDKKSGVNLGAIKEIQVLQEISHPNVIKVRPFVPRESMPARKSLNLCYNFSCS